MHKISTLFERINDHVVDRISPFAEGFDFEHAVATEKLDGTNVRLTVRNHTLVRLEKRRNPTKIQKLKGIVEPWYVDADEVEPNDKYMWEAAKNTKLDMLQDGEYSGEALGPKIQGNPLGLVEHIVFLFSVREQLENITFQHIPTTFAELKKWLPEQKSMYGANCGIEGIVWHDLNTGRMVKIKTKDF